MRRSGVTEVIAVLAVCTALAGCGGGSASTNDGSATSTSSSSSAPTTAASASPTEAAEPKLESAEDYVNAIMALVDTMSITAVYTPKTDPNDLMGRPGGYDSKANFADSRVPKDELGGLDKDDSTRGGSIEVYSDAAGAKKRSEYIQRVTDDVGFLALLTLPWVPERA